MDLDPNCLILRQEDTVYHRDLIVREQFCKHPDRLEVLNYVTDLTPCPLLALVAVETVSLQLLKGLSHLRTRSLLHYG